MGFAICVAEESPLGSPLRRLVLAGLVAADSTTDLEITFLHGCTFWDDIQCGVLLSIDTKAYPHLHAINYMEPSHFPVCTSFHRPCAVVVFSVIFVLLPVKF